MDRDFSFDEDMEQIASEIFMKPFYKLLQNRITRSHIKDTNASIKISERMKKRFTHILELEYNEITVNRESFDRYMELVSELDLLMKDIIIINSPLKGNLAREKWHLWKFLPKPSVEDLKKNRFNIDGRTGQVSRVLVDQFYLEMLESLKEIQAIAKKKYPHATDSYLSQYLESIYEHNKEFFDFLGFLNLPEWEHFYHNISRTVSKIKAKQNSFIEKILEQK